MANPYVYDALDRLIAVSQFGVTGGNAVAPKLASFTYNVASQMTDLRRYSNSVISTADLEVHSRYEYDGAARIASITHAKSEIALSYDRDNRLTAFASYADRFRTAYVYDVTDQLGSTTSSTIAGLATANPLPTTEREKNGHFFLI